MTCEKKENVVCLYRNTCIAQYKLKFVEKRAREKKGLMLNLMRRKETADEESRSHSSNGVVHTYALSLLLSFSLENIIFSFNTSLCYI